MLAATALAAAAAATTTAAASAAPTRTNVVRNCGTLSVGGRVWHVGAAGVSCRAAKGVVRRVAPKASGGSGTFFHASTSGLACTGGVSGSRRGITCVSKNGKQLVTGQSRG
jgi:hypothetical protein